MNKLNIFVTHVLLLSLFATHSVQSRTINTTLRRSVFNKLVSVKATSAGGLYENCLKLDITNNSPDTLLMTVDPAMIFQPDDTNYQDLVTMGTETVPIVPKETAKMSVFAYCGKSYARCPARNMNYTLARRVDSVLVKTMKHMKEQQVSTSLGQTAVWHFTNRHCLNTVYDHNNPRASEELVQFIAKERHSKVPDIFTEYETSVKPGMPVMVADGKATTYVVVKWKHANAPKHMIVTVLKENGDVYKRIYGNDQIDKEGHTVLVAFNSVNDIKGVYYVELKGDDGKVWDKQKVIVGYDPCNMM